MSDRAYAKAQVQQKTLSGSSPKSSLLQRTCACGQHTIAGGECSACRSEQSTVLRSQRTLGSSSTSAVTQGNSPAQENVLPFNAAADRVSRFGHDFSKIPVYSSQLPVLQTKLTANQPGDEYEQEADRISEQVMRMPMPQLQRACTCGGECPTCQEEQPGHGHEHLQTKRVQASDTGQIAAPPIVHEVLRSHGQPLDTATLAFMEQRFGYDFSQVRVHTDANAAESARAVLAKAYTLGRDVVFGAGQYAPESSEGRRLLAHELAHVVQQDWPGYATPTTPIIQRAPADDADCAADPDTRPMPSKGEFASSDDLKTVRASIFERQPAELGLGSSGPAVTLIQHLLLNIVCAGVDRKALKGELAAERYGPATSKAVKRFQREHTDAIGQPLNNDGQVGPLTLGAMDKIVGLKPLSPARKPEGKGECYGTAVDGPGEFIWFAPAEGQAILEEIASASDGAVPLSRGEAVWALSNFDIAKSFVKTEHREFLRDSVVKEINKQPSDEFLVRLVGEASTTASEEFNLRLSKARAHCVRQALLEAGLDSVSRIETEIGLGEKLAKAHRIQTLRELERRADPRAKTFRVDEVEDRTARKVSIVLAPRQGPCPPAVKKRASSKFTAWVECYSPTSARVNIGDISDPHQPTYREFIWVQFLPRPDGCVFRAGDILSKGQEWVKTDVNFHLANSDPDQPYAPSEFTGWAIHQANGASSKLVGAENPFSIGFGGSWQPESCGNTPTETLGQLLPIGPVRCGWVPAPPHGNCEPPSEEECSDDYKMKAAKHFRGLLGGLSADISKILPAELQPFISLAGSGALIIFITTDLEGPQLLRAFLYLGAKFGGSGEGLDRVKVASAPEKDVGTPRQLDTGGIVFNSDFNEMFFAKLVIHGASNKIEVDAGDAGTFTFFSMSCNYGETLTYYGALHSISPVICPGSLHDFGFTEKPCEEKEECSEKVRLAGHDSFTIKVGRATLASLPLLGRKLAKEHGCAVTAAFVNIQSEDGPENERIHREFILIARNEDCRFTVGQGQETLTLYLERQLTTKEPERILAPSDFEGIATLNKDGEMRIWAATNFPVKFKLPGAFDPACTGQRGATGVVVPVSMVDCGMTPEPRHDTTTDVSDVEKCNAFKAKNLNDVNNQTSKLAAPEYQHFLDVLPLPSPVVGVPPDVYVGLLLNPLGQRIDKCVFVGWATDPKTGHEIEVVGFADFTILAQNYDNSISIELLSDLCAFDKNGKVVLLSPEACLDMFARKGDRKRIYPHGL